MKSKSLFSMTVLGSFLILLAFPTTLSALPVTYCPYYISKPGVYTVQTNLTTCTPYGVYIQASYVTLNLNGYSITGTTGGVAGVFSKDNLNITIKGYGSGSVSHLGTITGFGAGIEISGDSGDRISHVHITSNGTGIDTSDGSGGNLFAYNAISGNGVCGICMNNAPGNQIIGNTIAGNGTGISIDSPAGTVMRRNAVVGNNGDGLWVDGDTEGLLIAENEFSCNKGDGINYAAGNGGMTIRGNAASANTGDGISLNGVDGSGVPLPPPSEIRWNTAGDNGEYGIALITSVNNSICYNITIGNGTDDLFWDGLGLSNFWVGNQFDTSGSPALPWPSSLPCP